MPAAPRLHELQQGFADAVLGRGDAVADWVDGAGLDPAARLRIYRHAVAGTLMAALRESYLAVHALVGDDFFDAMAARYRQQHPSTCGNLQQFGGSLADSMATMLEAQSLPYLADVARLEWRRQLAALAADASPVDAVTAAAAALVAPERLRIGLHPSLQWLRSDYAVLTLWQWCQSPSDAAPRVGGGEHVLLWRDGGEVAMAAVSPATFRCIERLADGCDVASAYLAAADVDNDFDLEPCLRDLLAQGLIVAFIDEEGAT
ncbi:MAG: DUF2063 domain-containing protein [Castellaniella sp.]|uniref:HvfC/BufC N-terminal domain-containing protein n=1 Tax=Castellaniella sp. TaxID=1955812 RepID=UPI0012028B9D|nr:DNA-binding domain-containing protein [Castellaniella sp.]TAN25060.1 MAG: DUF2063 domain-containing protein [Castellaniella sp.]